MHIIDISRELTAAPVFPGDKPPTVTRVKSPPRDTYTLTNIELCAHNATHLDAPRHFLAAGATMDEIPLTVFYGACVVADKLDDLTGVTRLLLKRGELNHAAATAVADSGVRLLGVEGQSVGSSDIHRILLRTGMVILEGLDLSGVPAGTYTLSAFPLSIAGVEGAPCRAVLIQEKGDCIV